MGLLVFLWHWELFFLPRFLYWLVLYSPHVPSYLINVRHGFCHFKKSAFPHFKCFLYSTCTSVLLFFSVARSDPVFSSFCLSRMDLASPPPSFSLSWFPPPLSLHFKCFLYSTCTSVLFFFFLLQLARSDPAFSSFFPWRMDLASPAPSFSLSWFCNLVFHLSLWSLGSLSFSGHFFQLFVRVSSEFHL